MQKQADGDTKGGWTTENSKNLHRRAKERGGLVVVVGGEGNDRRCSREIQDPRRGALK